ncbi:hypothetical protein TIFTF001_027077 [Ficus carica]|uniref:Strictosidine synthase conserved region domain-containing protein n=1 Tax=Ficus carica TaxID=3494 RepID=A0AA88DMG5_FICCA|nr:hypothetical protein TIFTF001_027077 [Ficus carica]
MLLFIILLSVPSNHIVLSQSLSTFQKLNLPSTSVGPESITFDSIGRGPYTGISDGRIVRYDKHNSRFVNFAYTSQNRTSILLIDCRSFSIIAAAAAAAAVVVVDVDVVRKNKLFIADALLGLFVVRGTKGGLASKLATSAEGVPFKFLNGLTVDQRNGDVYFTDFSSVFLLSQINEAIAANDSTGRLLKFNYRNQSVTVLLSGLSGANGVAISQDCSYLLVAEFIANRTRRYWLSGRRASTSEVVATFQGRPDNIRRTPLGDFWVAVNIPRPGVANSLEPTAIRIDGAGNNLQTFPLDKYYKGTTISEFLQRGVQYYAGSVDANFVGVFS